MRNASQQHVHNDLDMADQDGSFQIDYKDPNTMALAYSNALLGEPTLEKH